MATAHVVAQGETLYQIAAANGFPNWQVIYDHPSNAELRRRRPNPHVLHPGDVVQIPDAPKVPTIAVPLDRRTMVFRVPAGQQLFRLLVVGPDRKPVVDADYRLTFAGGERKGRTDPGGVIRDAIPVAVRRLTMTVGELSRDIDLGTLNPLGTDTTDGGVSGAKARLRNLGYFVRAVDGAAGAEFAGTLRRFQTEQGLPVTGVLDDATRARLQTGHGS